MTEEGLAALATAADVAAAAVVAALGAWDLARRRLPLALNRTLLALGLVGAWAVAGGSLGAAVLALAAGLACAAPLAALARLARQRGESWRMMGGGDVRLALGLGAWLGLPHALAVLALGALIALAGGIALGAWRRAARAEPLRRTAAMPFGATAAVALALLAVP
jgi:leader peptidase (prepilin peptidase)/N-methyltransferase